jgi:ribosomal protein S27E
MDINIKTMRKTRNYSEKEWDALRGKYADKNKYVECPRCGNEIVYINHGNSISVECLSDGCIFGGVRGV